MPLGPIAREPQSQIKAKLQQADKESTQFAAAITNSEFLTVVALCLIGLLVALNLIFYFPDFGAVIAEYNKF